MVTSGPQVGQKSTGTKVPNLCERRSSSGRGTLLLVSTLLDSGLLVHALDRSPDGMLIVGGDGVIHFANAAIAALTGRPAEDFFGRSVEELVPETLRGAHREYRRSYMAKPSQRSMGSGLELTLLRRDGTMVPVEVSLSPLSHDGTDYVIAAVRDVSDRIDNQHRLATAHEQLALASERARIGRDLHDVVLQHLYGMGLSVQAIAAGTEPEIAARLDAAIDEIDRIISEVRTIVFTLGTSASNGTLGQELADVMAQSSRVLGFTPALSLKGPVESVITEELRGEMVASMREALGNVARHAHASKVFVTVEVAEGNVIMKVKDNGVGPPADLARVYSGGRGLANLRSRAASLGGSCALTAGVDEGSVVIWTVPFH
jgi:PAS domain S-box-containing protein